MTRGLTTASVCVAVACAFIWFSAAGAAAKGPDQAVITGPGVDQPIVVRAPGSPTIGQRMATLINASGIMDQLWCRACPELLARQPTSTDLGPMFKIRYRVPSLIGGPTRWVEQHVYPFAHPAPVTYVVPGQPFWHQETAGGWYVAGPKMRQVLVDVGVPRQATPSSPWVETASVTPIGVSIALIATGIALAIAIIVGLAVLMRAWSSRTRSAHSHPA
jgi:hypothetical protein